MRQFSSLSRYWIVPAILIACLLTTASCASKSRDVDVQRMFGSKDAMAPVEMPWKVEAYRVDPKQNRVKPGVNHVGGFAVVTGPIDVGRHSSPEMSELFRAKSSYKWRDVAPECEFKPTVAIRFINEAGARTDLLMAFECNEMAVYHQGKRVGTGYFDASREKIVEIIKLLFPNDGYIRKL
jgi:hypothetical protein